MNNENKKTEIAKREEKILNLWEKNKTFERSLDKNSPQKPFIFYDGPPFATGTPHYGHIIGSTVKDVIGRYKTMHGYHVPRKWGWDCHGLPIENIAEKSLNISGRDEIEKIGIEKFNEYAREKVLGFVNDWKNIVSRIGRWVDFDGSYKTMDNSYIESVWWALKEMNKKGLLYEGERVLPYCPRCETPISNSEIAMDNSYKDIKDLSVIVKFKITNEKERFILVWTTTPWTLPGNTALAVGEKIEYVEVSVKDSSERYVVAKDLLEKVFETIEYKIISSFKGKELVGKKYEPIFDYFHTDKNLENHKKGWAIYGANFINTEEGTGVVHIAPAFGEDDMELAKKNQLPIVKHVNHKGEFTEKVKDLAGIKIKPKEDHQSGDVHMIKKLAKSNSLFSKLKFEHSYPHCHRCETPLYYYAISSWFIKIQDVKKDMIKLNEKISWIPKHLKHGRFKHVLEGAPDWNISRNRYWASPLPIWKCKCDNFKVIGSLKELQDLAIQKVPNLESIDLHRPHIDKYTLKCDRCSDEMKRIPEVFDCWFESGSMPFASQHFPFENKANFNPYKKIGFPADFIAEYIPQTRTWFYYMLAVSTMLFKETSFLNVVTTGTILASDGRKMSKSLNNFSDPQEIFNQYGVDALRLYLLSTPLMKGEDIKFKDKGVEEVATKTFGRLVNVYNFYSIYKDTKKHTANDKSKNVLDRWIIAKTRKLLKETTLHMDNYELDRATKEFANYVDDLSAWYLRRSRVRIKEGDIDAFQTTLWILREFSKILAPFTPFHADWLWMKVREPNEPESVHLTDWSSLSDFDEKILKEMEIIRNLITQALDVRNSINVPVRQPLQSATFKGKDMDIEYKEIIADEINVKQVMFDEKADKNASLDEKLTPQLIKEGKIRNIIRMIQQSRKKHGFTLDQTADATVYFKNEEKKTIEENIDHISELTSVRKFTFKKGDEFEIKLTVID